MAQISYIYDVSPARLKRLHLVNQLSQEFASDGGDVVLVDGKPAGWIKQDDMGVLEGIELLPQYQRQGLGKQILLNIFQGQPFKAFLPNDAGMALLKSYGQVQDIGDGYFRVDPNPVVAWVRRNCRFAIGAEHGQDD